MDFNIFTINEHTNLERRLRRKLLKNGYILLKGRDIYGIPGYMIADAESKFCVAGHFPREFCLGIGDVEES